MDALGEAVQLRRVRRSRAGGPPDLLEDAVAVEEPLEIRLDGAPVAVVMRTPGDDFELAAGFLLAEGLLRGPDELAGISWCRPPGERGRTNRVSVATVGGDGHTRVAARRRVVTTGSACGLCGRVLLEEVHRPLPRVAPAVLELAALQRAQRVLTDGQTLFRATGAVHGAAVVDPAGEVVARFEDVGRHNAVDKCVGRLALTRGLPLDRHLLAVSGRVSFEIVQKAAVAGIAAICGVGGVSSLAVELAAETGLLLAGFVRDGRCNVYAGHLADTAHFRPGVQSVSGTPAARAAARPATKR